MHIAYLWQADNGLGPIGVKTKARPTTDEGQQDWYWDVPRRGLTVDRDWHAVVSGLHMELTLMRRAV